MIPNRLALKLVNTGYIFRDDSIWYKKNNVSSSSKDNLTPAVWEIATRAHYGNEHFAIFPEALVSRILKFAPEKGDWVLDPFAV